MNADLGSVLLGVCATVIAQLIVDRFRRSAKDHDLLVMTLRQTEMEGKAFGTITSELAQIRTEVGMVRDRVSQVRTVLRIAQETGEVPKWTRPEEDSGERERP